MPFDLGDFGSGLLGAAIGGAAAILSTIFTIRHERDKIEAERRGEREKELQNLAGRYLTISQDTVDFLWFRLKYIYDVGGKYVKSKDREEMITIYALAKFFAVKQIMTLEGAYSNIQAAYPDYPDLTRKGTSYPKGYLPVPKHLQEQQDLKERLKLPFEIKNGYGARLLNQFEAVDSIINDIVVNMLPKDSVHFYRYHREQLGEAMMERELGRWNIRKFLDFEEKYFHKNNEDRKLPEFLERAMYFFDVLAVTTENEDLLSAYRDHESPDKNEMTPDKVSPFKKLMAMLQIISDDLSDVTQLPSTIPQDKRITVKTTPSY
jgi:hypothetical protein